MLAPDRCGEPGRGGHDALPHLRPGVDPNVQWGKGITPLLGNLRQQRARAALFMIEQVPGCDVNLGGPEGVFALTSAAQDGMLRVMRALMAKGADVDAVDDHGFPVIMFAFNARQEAAAVYLIEEAGASWKMPDPRYSLYQMASFNCMPRLLWALVKHLRRDGVGEAVVQQELAEIAAQAICEREPIKALEMLVSVGRLDAKRASIMGKTEGVGAQVCRTPLLHLACQWGDAPAAEFLVAQGCDPKQADRVGALLI